MICKEIQSIKSKVPVAMFREFISFKSRFHCDFINHIDDQKFLFKDRNNFRKERENF